MKLDYNLKLKSGYLIYDRPLLKALGTLSALGPWLEDGDGDDEVLDGIDGRVAGLVVDDRGVAVPGQVDGVCRCPL